MSRERRLVGIYKSTNEAEAQVIKGLLESFEIPSVLKHNAGGLGLDTGSEIVIMVSEEKADEAKWLIKDDEDV